MTRFASNYPVGRSTRTCAATGRSLAEGERCIAALVENDREQLERLDFSLDAWEAGARPTGRGLRLIGFWRTTATAAERHRGPVLDEESLLELLTGIEPGEPRRDALRLVLALSLRSCFSESALWFRRATSPASCWCAPAVFPSRQRGRP
jgi:hypothetical protein